MPNPGYRYYGSVPGGPVGQRPRAPVAMLPRGIGDYRDLDVGVASLPNPGRPIPQTFHPFAFVRTGSPCRRTA
jgi:hypothetical protein